MTQGKKLKQEIGTLEILTDRSIHEVKSPDNAVQWIIFLGEEEYDVLKEELTRAIPVINELNKIKKVNLK